MRLLRVVGSLTLPCGCLVGRYEAYSGQTVAFLDSKGERDEAKRLIEAEALVAKAIAGETAVGKARR